MYVAELLNRFIGNRISNVAILSTWPWIRKWNDRSINLLIPAAAGWNTVFLTVPLASICAIRTVVIIILLHSNIQNEGVLPRSLQFPPKQDKEWKLELISTVKSRWRFSLQLRDNVDFTFRMREKLEIQWDIIQTSTIPTPSSEFPFRHKVREQTCSRLIRARVLVKIYATIPLGVSRK